MWSHKWLSWGARFILSKYVLQRIYIYWMHFFKHPNKIINKINSIISQFMWVGYFLEKNTCCKGGEVIKFGGCRVGIFNIWKFSTKCYGSNPLADYVGDSLWSRIIKAKYIYSMNILGWMHAGTLVPSWISQSWRSFRYSSSLVICHVKLALGPFSKSTMIFS